MTAPVGISPYYIGFLTLVGAYNLLKDKLFAKGEQTIKVESAAQSIFPTLPQTILLTGAGFAAGAAATQAGTCPAAPLLLAAPAGAAGGAAGAASGSFFSSFSDGAFNAASAAARFAWSQLSWSMIAAGGVGLLGLAYAVYKVVNPNSGVNVNVTNNNKIVFEVPAHTQVVQKTDPDGTLRLSIKDHQALVQLIKQQSVEENQRLAQVVRNILEEEALKTAAPTA